MAANHATLKPTVAKSASGKALNFLAICFLFSGATGLIYEVVWARMLGLVFGATTIAISAVLTAFMGGLALGSAVAARLAARIIRPLRAYALIEISIGLYALIVPALFRTADVAYAAMWQSFHSGFYGFAFLRLVLAAMVLIVPTAMMGATLPVIVLAGRQLGDFKASAVAKLYSLNLTGAIGGTIAAGFLLLPYFGVRATTRVAALTNLFIGIAVFVFDSRRTGSVIQVEQANAHDSFAATEIVSQARQPGFWFACAFASGLVTIAMQLWWSRVLAMIIGSSTYAFTIVLTLFLIGLSLGSWIVSAKAGSNLIKLRRSIMFVQLTTALSILVSLRITNAIPSWLIQSAFRFGVNSWAGLLALQIVAAAILILLPAILMGMTMPIVLVWAGQATGKSDGKRGANSVGLSYSINTIGAIAGALVAAFILIPGTGARLTAFCVASICIVIAGAAYDPGAAVRDRALARSLSIGITALLIILAFAVWPRLNVNALSIGAYDSFVRVLARSRGDVHDNENDRPEDHQLLMFQEGRTATVSVRRDWGITSVAINGRTNASDAGDMPTQVMLGQLGVVAAPRLDHGLIVGFATGVTAGSVLQSSIGSVDCVEIEPAAIASSRYFEHVNDRPLSDARLHLIVDDARTYLRVNPNLYDIIVSEPSHPWVPGVANLFTREFFTLGRDRLLGDGVFVQWLQIYQLSNESLRSVLRTFSEVFPHLAVFRIQGAAKGKDLILLGSRSPISFDGIGERMKEARVAADLKRVGIETAADLMKWFVCDETRLRPAVAGAVINTDDNMHVESVAPREAFRATMVENSSWIESLTSLPVSRR